MFGIGVQELLVILVVALIVLGPERLPEVARMLGKGMAELRKATSGLSDELRGARSLLDDEVQSLRRLTTPPEARPRPQPGTAPRAPLAAPPAAVDDASSSAPSDTADAERRDDPASQA